MLAGKLRHPTDALLISERIKKDRLAAVSPKFDQAI
jgi:hypothetical protein